MMQRIIGLLLGGATVVAVLLLVLLGLDLGNADKPVTPSDAETPVSVVINQESLSGTASASGKNPTSEQVSAGATATDQTSDGGRDATTLATTTVPQTIADSTNTETEHGSKAVAKLPAESDTVDLATGSIGLSEKTTETQTLAEPVVPVLQGTETLKPTAGFETPATPSKVNETVSPAPEVANEPAALAVASGNLKPVEAQTSTQVSPVAPVSSDNTDLPKTLPVAGSTVPKAELAKDETVTRPAPIAEEGAVKQEPVLTQTTQPVAVADQAAPPSIGKDVSVEPQVQPSEPSKQLVEQQLAMVEPAAPIAVEADEEPAKPEVSIETGVSVEPEPSGPKFDVVRVDRDGQTVIAGRAEPGERVEVLIDGEVVGDATADGSGQFVAVIFASLSDAAQSLELRSKVPELSDEAPQISTQLQGLATPGIGAGDPAAPLIGGSGSTGVRHGGVSTDLGTNTQFLVPSASGTVAAAIPATGQRYAVSTPVIILPSSAPDAAPTLVQPQRDQLAVLQPVESKIAGVVLDSITYDEKGAVVLSGRGVAGRAIRIYANGRQQTVVRVASDGRWRWATNMEDPESIKLFRMDEIGSAGEVTSRIETPFEYSRLSPQVVRDRRVVIQQGDMLWRIAEQFYGDGIRYSSIYGANTELIRDPDLIYPGQVFTIPELVDAN